jgi:hypothetical protein
VKLLKTIGWFSLALLSLMPPALSAKTFTLMVAPGRFELQAKPGQVVRQVVRLTNPDVYETKLRVRTADWALQPNGGVRIFPPELQPGSCRPWVRIERRNLSLAPKADHLYRFEVHVPKDAKAGECRVALLLSPADQSVMAKAGDIEFPVEGRIAVIVYVRVGDAHPRLKVDRLELHRVNGHLTPVAIITNKGNAHGRPQGMLSGQDSSNQQVDFSVAPLPILPGQTRMVPIWPMNAEGVDTKIKIHVPLHLKGRILWDGGQKDVDARLK